MMETEDTLRTKTGLSSSSVDRVSYHLLWELGALLLAVICATLHPYTPKSCVMHVASTQYLLSVWPRSGSITHTQRRSAKMKSEVSWFSAQSNSSYQGRHISLRRLPSICRKMQGNVSVLPPLNNWYSGAHAIYLHEVMLGLCCIWQCTGAHYWDISS